MKNSIKALLATLCVIFLLACNEENTPDIYTLNITVTPENSGNVIPSPDLRLVAGEELQVLATSVEGYAFVNWTGSVSSNENPLTITVTEDLDLTANFLLRNYALTTTTVGNGTVTETIITSKTDYDHGTLVELQAIPDEGWRFLEWSGDVSSENESIQVTVTSPLTITATFEIDTVTPIPVEKSNSTKVFMHYMPWFQTGPFDGFWGTHWTMNNRNPENIVGGKRELASHYYPLIGPYSSKDPDVAEYHLLLMKYAGIDGILIDWYGTYDVNDYRLNLEGSENIISLTDDIGIDFGIVYEDQTTPAVVNAGQASTLIEAATTDFNYINQNYFSEPSYIRIDGNPLALAWTPIEIETGSAWDQILSDVDPNLLFLSLWYQISDLGSNGDGEYGWVFGGNGNHLQDVTNFYLSRLNRYEIGIGSAYPGFVDFYEEGGQGDVIGWEIPHNGAATLEATLDLATQYNVEYLQLVTWNDFGEGTMIEPTEEFGYTFLNTIQGFTGVVYGEEELELIYDFYIARKQYADDDSAQQTLDLVFNNLITLQVSNARTLLNSLGN